MELYLHEHNVDENQHNEQEGEETLNEYIRRITEEFISQSTNAVSLIFLLFRLHQLQNLQYVTWK